MKLEEKKIRKRQITYLKEDGTIIPFSGWEDYAKFYLFIYNTYIFFSYSESTHINISMMAIYCLNQ